jgi:hypothetical protein
VNIVVKGAKIREILVSGKGFFNTFTNGFTQNDIQETKYVALLA